MRSDNMSAENRLLIKCSQNVTKVIMGGNPFQVMIKNIQWLQVEVHVLSVTRIAIAMNPVPIDLAVRPLLLPVAECFATDNATNTNCITNVLAN